MMWTPIEILNLIWAQLWQVTLVAVLVGLTSYLLRTRHCHPMVANSLWLIVLAKALTPPIWANPMGIFSWTMPHTTVATATLTATQTATPTQLSGTSLTNSWSGIFICVLGAIWLAGFIRVMATHLLRWRELQKLIQATSLPVVPELTDRVELLANRLGFRRVPPLVVTKVELGPAVVGIWKPRIIMPQSLINSVRWQELEPIVAHELLHLSRRDTAIGALQLLANAVWWFHPLIRWAGRQVEEASERCVDLAVLHVAGCDPAIYCRSLLRVLESRVDNPQCLLIAAPAVRGVSVTGERIRELAEVPAQPSVRQRAMNLALVGILAIVFLPGRPLESLRPRCCLAEVAVRSNLDGERTELSAALKSEN